jgi:hypothetical protein
MKIIRHGRNIHHIELKGERVKMAMLSDIHWDNPKCDWDLLKKHLDYCLEQNIPIHFNGDTFCLMQGSYDPRKVKGNIRPEHNTPNYFDAVIETAVEFFAPYAHLITVVGYGNHETSILRRQEIDQVQRFVDLMNFREKTNIQAGGYGGWLVIRQMDKHGSKFATNIKYHHGIGNGGIVTRGALQMNRALTMFENYDVFTHGHTHDNSCMNLSRDTLTKKGKSSYKMTQKNIHTMLTGTYKNDYDDGAVGWTIERGHPPKPVGGRILEINCKRNYSKNMDSHTKLIDSYKFPVI